MLEFFSDKSILDLLFDLIDSPKCVQIVVNFVLEMIHNLVTYADFKEGDEKAENDDYELNVKELPFNVDFITNEFKNSSNFNVNFGNANAINNLLLIKKMT